MKTVKWLLVAILLMQAIQTAVLWYGLVIYPYVDDEEDDSGMVQQSRLSRFMPHSRLSNATLRGRSTAARRHG
jgi:hypothetical protein